MRDISHCKCQYYISNFYSWYLRLNFGSVIAICVFWCSFSKVLNKQMAFNRVFFLMDFGLFCWKNKFGQNFFSKSFSFLVSHSSKEIFRTKHVRIYRMWLFAGLFQSLDRKCKAKVLICSAGPRGSGVLRRISQSCVLASRTINQKCCGCNKDDVWPLKS